MWPVVGAWLGRLGLDETALACGPHAPLHQPSATAMLRAGTIPSRIHNNCSGKHAGMLAAALQLSAPTRGYELPHHAVQRHCAGAIAALAGLDRLPEPGIDGCGLPNHPLPLRGLARAAAILADPGGEAPSRRAALIRIGAAMRAQPHMVAGTGRCCTALMSLLPDVIAKTGAEGAYLAALPARGLGIALKAEDGATRAAETALLALLAHLGALGGEVPEGLQRFRTPRLRNTAGSVVGHVRPAAGWPGLERPNRRGRRGRARPAGRAGGGGRGHPEAAHPWPRQLEGALGRPARRARGHHPPRRPCRPGGGVGGRDRAPQHPGRHAAGHAPRGAAAGRPTGPGPGRRQSAARLDAPVRCVVGGDATVPEISAASIVAKVARDALMCRLALRYPGYGWERNAGYPTREHLAALARLGHQLPSPPWLRAMRALCGHGRWRAASLPDRPQLRPSIAAQNASRARKLSALSLGERISRRKAQPGQEARLVGQAQMMPGADPVLRGLAVRRIQREEVDQGGGLVRHALALVELQQGGRGHGPAEPAIGRRPGPGSASLADCRLTMAVMASVARRRRASAQ